MKTGTGAWLQPRDQRAKSKYSQLDSTITKAQIRKKFFSSLLSMNLILGRSKMRVTIQ